ncbi:putative Serine/threonine-protein phosphatase 6 catalytic subunit [Blattamonas nauphoetae]|uniref:Serine/threonine-protein phosphatase n=1 Tax=Blattamonas nauphoetae TaxID=2049346 RepID=A0ABQ9XG28_9EUKA|nr:putative Serine/threonine-protein phosphatase 6 catalytic subunit [Blattamonas nauphoetae]
MRFVETDQWKIQFTHTPFRSKQKRPRPRHQDFQFSTTPPPVHSVDRNAIFPLSATSPFLFDVHTPFPGVQRPANRLAVTLKLRESQGDDRRTEADVIDDNTVVHEMRSSSIPLRVAGGYQWGEAITDTLRRSRQQRMDGLAGVERELERIKTTHFDRTSHARPPDRASSSPQTSRSFTRQTEPNFAQTLPAQFVPPLHLSTTSPEPDRPKQLTRPDSTRRAVMVMAALSLDDIAPGAKSVHPPKANTNRSPVEPEPKQDTPQPTKPVEAPTPSLPRVNTEDWLSLGNETPSMHQHTNSDTHFDTSFTSDLSTDPLMRRRTLDAGTGEESEERPAEPHSDSEEIPSLPSPSEQHSPPAPQRTVSPIVLDPDSPPHSPDLTIERAAQIVKDFEFKGIQSLARPLSSLVRPVSAETRTSSVEPADDIPNAESDHRQEASTPEVSLADDASDSDPEYEGGHRRTTPSDPATSARPQHLSKRQRRADEESRRSADRKSRLDRLRASGEEISAAQQARFKSHEHSGVFSKLKHAMDLVEDEKRARKERRERLLSIGRNASKSPASRGTRKGHKKTPKKRQHTNTAPPPNPNVQHTFTQTDYAVSDYISFDTSSLRYSQPQTPQGMSRSLRLSSRQSYTRPLRNSAQLTKTTPFPSPRPDDTQFVRSLRPLNKFLFDFHVDPPYNPNSAVHTDDKQTRTIPQQTQPGIVSLHAPCPIGQDAADHTVEEIDRNYPPSSVYALRWAKTGSEEPLGRSQRPSSHLDRRRVSFQASSPNRPRNKSATVASRDTAHKHPLRPAVTPSSIPTNSKVPPLLMLTSTQHSIARSPTNTSLHTSPTYSSPTQERAYFPLQTPPRIRQSPTLPPKPLHTPVSTPQSSTRLSISQSMQNRHGAFSTVPLSTSHIIPHTREQAVGLSDYREHLLPRQNQTSPSPQRAPSSQPSRSGSALDDAIIIPESPSDVDTLFVLQFGPLSRPQTLSADDSVVIRVPGEMAFDLDKSLEKAKKRIVLDEIELINICDYVIEILLEESTVTSLSSPITICGDIHGQFYDLMQLFNMGGEVPHTKYVFMGDYVDRGSYSLECFTLLTCLKARYPERIFMLRGNHESRQVSSSYGYKDQCLAQYGNAQLWNKCMDLFDCLPIAALIDERVMCVHGGLSPEVKTIDQIRLIQRCQEVPQVGAFSDLMWSDPDESVDGWQQSPRGAGYYFGQKVSKEFNELNGLSLVCRAHQLVMEGYKYSFPDESLVTVWSAPNYCYRCGNIASILQLDEQLSTHFILFSEVPDSKRETPERQPVSYFL